MVQDTPEAVRRVADQPCKVVGDGSVVLDDVVLLRSLRIELGSELHGVGLAPDVDVFLECAQVLVRKIDQPRDAGKEVHTGLLLQSGDHAHEEGHPANRDGL
jgi:hypothetical protein